jgi:hypothetical protein
MNSIITYHFILNVLTTETYLHVSICYTAMPHTTEWMALKYIKLNLFQSCNNMYVTRLSDKWGWYWKLNDRFGAYHSARHVKYIYVMEITLWRNDRQAYVIHSNFRLQVIIWNWENADFLCSIYLLSHVFLVIFAIISAKKYVLQRALL